MASLTGHSNGRLHYALPLETFEVAGRLFESAAVVVNVPAGRVSIRDCRACPLHYASGAAPLLHTFKGSDISLVERDVLYLKLLKVTVASAEQSSCSLQLTLCFKSHSARDTCAQLLQLLRPGTCMWLPRPGPSIPSNGGVASLSVDGCVTFPVSETGVVDMRLHCCLVHTSAVRPSPQYLSESLRGHVSQKSGLFCVCLRGMCALEMWTSMLLHILPGFTLMASQGIPADQATRQPHEDTTLLLLADTRHAPSITYITSAAFVHPHSTALGIAFRANETSVAAVAHFYASDWTGAAHRTERGRACKRVLSGLNLSNAELDVLNQFDHIFWIGQYQPTSDETPSTSVLESPPLLGVDRTGIWFRSLAAPAVGLSYAFADPYEGDADAPPPLSVVYEFPTRLPCLSAFAPHSLVIDFEYIELHCKGVPSLPAVALVFYPTGPFASYAGSSAKHLERGRKVHTWTKHELPRLEVACGYPLEYLRAQLLHVSLRDVESSVSCNLVGVASADLSRIPPAASPGEPVFAQISAPYIRHDTVWGHMLIAMTISPSGTPMEPGLALKVEQPLVEKRPLSPRQVSPTAHGASGSFGAPPPAGAQHVLEGTVAPRSDIRHSSTPAPPTLLTSLSDTDPTRLPGSVTDDLGARSVESTLPATPAGTYGRVPATHAARPPPQAPRTYETGLPPRGHYDPGLAVSPDTQRAPPPLEHRAADAARQAVLAPHAVPVAVSNRHESPRRSRPPGGVLSPHLNPRQLLPAPPADLRWEHSTAANLIPTHAMSAADSAPCLWNTVPAGHGMKCGTPPPSSVWSGPTRHQSPQRESEARDVAPYAIGDFRRPSAAQCGYQAASPLLQPAPSPKEEGDWEEEVAFQCTVEKDAMGRLGVMLSEDLRVARVNAQGSASKVGVAAGMRVCSVNHTVVRSTAEYFAALALAPTQVRVVLSCPSKLLPPSKVLPHESIAPAPCRPAAAPSPTPHIAAHLLVSPASDAPSAAWNLCPTPEQRKAVASAVTMQF